MTDLSGIQQAVQKIAEQTLQDQAKSGNLDRGSANAGDIQKLQEALNQLAGETPAVNGTASTQGVEPVNGLEEMEQASPGARLLESVQNMRTDLQDAMKELTDVLANTNELSPSDMLRAQMRFQQISMQQDLMSKVVSKSEQNVDQLLKGQ
jgi:type III secretion system YscI/HrpB-like protein